jgi:hypothetical protein
MNTQKFLQNFLQFNLDPVAMDARLKQRVSPWEVFGLLFGCAWVGMFIWFFSLQGWYPEDLKIYLAGRASPGFFYGYWSLPVFELLRLLPPELAYAIWALANILGCFYAVRVFGGKPLLVLLSYSLISLLYYGQIGGILAGGLALCWWGVAHRKWDWAGLGFLIALTKYQVGLTLGLLMLWYAGITWRNFARLLLVPLVVGIISLIVYPLWPFEVLRKMVGFPYIDLGITFWILIGPWTLLFWIPALVLPLSKPERFLALFALFTFAVPYFLQFDLVTLFAMPIGWLPLFNYLGLSFPFLDKLTTRSIAIIPVLCYLIAIWPGMKKVWKRFSQE